MKRKEKEMRQMVLHILSKDKMFSIKQGDQGRDWKITESVEKLNGTTRARYGKEKIITLQRKALEK